MWELIASVASITIKIGKDVYDKVSLAKEERAKHQKELSGQVLADINQRLINIQTEVNELKTKIFNRLK